MRLVAFALLIQMVRLTVDLDAVMDRSGHRVAEWMPD